MERLNHYRECVKKLIAEESKSASSYGQVVSQPVFDLEHDQYLLVDMGWDGQRRIYNCVLHLSLQDNKIWIQRNQTDRSLAEILSEMGVSKEDIVLALQPDYVRQYTGYGVA
jgi:predicted MPP superfamily phosphohydrolase